jgi:cytochrome b6-f complex iron-sulfur subunit
VNRAGQGYHCPCHGSAFDDEGSVKSGPAPRGLEWFAVAMSRDNRLVVDKGLRVGADKYLVL